MLSATLKHRMTESMLFIESFDSYKGLTEVEFVENYLKLKAEKAKLKKKKVMTEDKKQENDGSGEDSEYGSEGGRSRGSNLS